jgi:hypothetical protein
MLRALGAQHGGCGLHGCHKRSDHRACAETTPHARRVRNEQDSLGSHGGWLRHSGDHNSHDKKSLQDSRYRCSGVRSPAGGTVARRIHFAQSHLIVVIRVQIA